MANSKTIARRFLSIATISSASPVPCVNNKPFILKKHLPGSRFTLQTAAVSYSDNIRMGNKLMESIRHKKKEKEKEEGVGIKISVDEAKKIVRAWQLEQVKNKLRGMGSYISHSEFVGICGQVTGRVDLGSEIAQLLDNSGVVIVVGDIVFLQPDQVARAIESIIPLQATPRKDLQRKDLKEMEEKKAAIDTKAEAQVKMELWGGLVLISLQTAASIRLTFWELSWDVMEPICFFATTFYFMACYAFFLRTYREPSFQGFFLSRFAIKQKRLMKAHDFDTEKFDELKRAYYGSSSIPNSCYYVRNHKTTHIYSSGPINPSSF